jgi:hypothetical protein
MWSNYLRSSTVVKRAFPGGAPDLLNLSLLRIVFSRESIRIALNYSSIPNGATDKWRKKGYQTIDAIFTFDLPIVRVFSAHHVVASREGHYGETITVNLQEGVCKVISDVDGASIIEVEFRSVDVDFVPDPFMQQYEKNRDERGTNIESDPFAPKEP